MVRLTSLLTMHAWLVKSGASVLSMSALPSHLIKAASCFVPHRAMPITLSCMALLPVPSRLTATRGLSMSSLTREAASMGEVIRR